MSCPFGKKIEKHCTPSKSDDCGSNDRCGKWGRTISSVRGSYADGIRAAAAFMSDWDKQINCPYRIEDVILCKFNLSKRKSPRKKKV